VSVFTGENQLARIRPHRPRPHVWRSGSCSALSHRFEVFSDGGEQVAEVFAPLVAQLRDHTSKPPMATPGRYDICFDPDERVPYQLWFSEERVASGVAASDLVGLFVWHVNHMAIEISVHDYVLLHSAAAVRSGVTVLLPADQECGKTTTVAGLLRSGFDYVTDEAVAIDPTTGGVTPFPKNLTLDEGSWRLFPECAPPTIPDWRRQWHVPAWLLGAKALTCPVPPPRVVVFPRYEAGADTRLNPISQAEALRELAQLTFGFHSHPGRNLRVLARTVTDASVARLTIGSLPRAVDTIEGLVSEKLMEDL
jgi:hypothetical protein